MRSHKKGSYQTGHLNKKITFKKGHIFYGIPQKEVKDFLEFSEKKVLKNHRISNLEEGIYLLLRGVLIRQESTKDRILHSNIYYSQDIVTIGKADDQQFLSRNNSVLVKISLKKLNLLLKKPKPITFESFYIKELESQKALTKVRATAVAEKRLQHFIKFLGSKIGIPMGYETFIKHGLTQQLMADTIFISRQTVTTCVNTWKRENASHHKGNTILVRDMNSFCD